MNQINELFTIFGGGVRGGERDRGRWEIRRYGIFYFPILLSVKVCLWLREYVFKDYDEDEVKLKIAQKQSNPLKILIFQETKV